MSKIINLVKIIDFTNFFQSIKKRVYKKSPI